MNTLKSAYNAGFRAGRNEPRHLWINGVTLLEWPENPFTAWQFIRCALWDMGKHDGMMKRLNARKGF